MLKVKFNKEEYGHKNKYELISYIRYCRELLGMYQSTLKKIAKCVILESLKQISKCVKGSYINIFHYQDTRTCINHKFWDSIFYVDSMMIWEY